MPYQVWAHDFTKFPLIGAKCAAITVTVEHSRGTIMFVRQLVNRER